MSGSSVTLSSSGENASVELEFDTLLDVCRKVSVLQPGQLLQELLHHARKLVRAEAGTVFRVIPGELLHFACAQNDARPDLCVEPDPDDEGGGRLKGVTIPIDNASLAGYAANNRQPLCIEDVYNLPDDVDYNFSSRYDKASGYRTKSMLVIPMLDQQDRPVGVLQLINRTEGDGVTQVFSARDEQIAMALASMAAISVHNALLLDNVRTKNEQLKLAHLETVMRLATAAELRDDDTGRHIKRVSMYCETLARKLGFSEDYAYNIMCASPMHDIGKLGIPDAILTKPGKLTDEERTEMQRHTTEGAKILSDSPHALMQSAERIAHSHHERWDGRGYPRGIAGGDIPIEGRITAVADVFDALTSKRCYKPPFSIDKAFSIIVEDSGTHFDPDVVKAFVAARDEIEIIHESFGDPDD